MLRTVVEPVSKALEGFSSEEIFAAIERRRTGTSEDVPVKEAEFEVLASGHAITGIDTPESNFFSETVERALWDDWDDPLLSPVENVVLVHRLREVVAQIGFTRFEPPAPEVDGELDLKVERQLLDRDVNWLPAIENRGEGIFIQIKADAVDSWLQRAEVSDRINVLMRGFDQWATERGSDRRFPGGGIC